MIENVKAFFERYREDETLRRRIAESEAVYPGSLEVRESVVEYVLLPIAHEIGLPFTVEELRAYETRLKLTHVQPDEPIPDGDPIDDDPLSFWLLDRGWENDPKFFRKKD